MSDNTLTEDRIELIAERLVAADQQSDLGQTFRVFPAGCSVHLDHNSHIADEYLYYTETEGKSFDDSIEWPEAAKTRETFDPDEHVTTPGFWVERIRPYVEAGEPFLVQTQVVEDREHTDACGWAEENDDCQGGHAWPAWALMIAEAK